MNVDIILNIALAIVFVGALAVTIDDLFINKRGT